MKPVSIETLFDYQFLSDPALSPDGKHTAFLVHQGDLKSNGYHSALHLYKHRTGQQKQLTTSGKVTAFSWLDDHTLVFPSDRDPETQKKVAQGEELTQYFTLDITGGEAQPLMTLGIKSGKLYPLSSKTYLVSAQYDNNRPNVEGLSEAERLAVLADYKDKGYTIFEEIPFWDNAKGVVNRKRNRLYLVDATTHVTTPITEPLFQVESFDVSKTHILYQGSAYDTARPLDSGLYLYTIATGETTCLVEPGKLHIKLALLYGTDKAVISYGTIQPYGVNQNGDVYLLDLTTGAHSFLVDHKDAPIGNNSTGSDARYGGGRGTKILGDTLYYVTTQVNHSYLSTLNLITGERATLTTDGSVNCFDITVDNTVMMAMKGNQLTELYSLSQGSETQLTHFNDSTVTDYSLSTPKAFTCVNRDNFEVYGYVMEPVGYVKGNKYPAILHIHGGPRTVFSDIFHHEMQLWASRGYFVFYCNPHGSDGRGNEFGDLTAKYGTIDYQDIMDFTDAVLTAYPDIDGSRVGVTGGSYGGFMTNWIIGHTDRFKVACAQRSIANWTSFEGTTDIGFYFAKDQVGASHLEDQALQWQQSPLAYADQVTTPTLFIHSEQDYRCWMVEGLQMFTALKMHQVPARLCLLRGDTHELSRSGQPRNRVKRMEEILAWMDGYLKE